MTLATTITDNDQFLVTAQNDYIFTAATHLKRMYLTEQKPFDTE